MRMIDGIADTLLERHTNEEKKLLSALRQKKLREIILLVLSEERVCFKELSFELG